MKETTLKQGSQRKDFAEPSKSPRKWQPCGKYAIRSEPYQISKAMLDGSTLYILWRDDKAEPLGYFVSAGDCTDWLEGQR